MRRHIPELQVERETPQLDGVFLARVERARYCYHRLKPFFTLSFVILEPAPLAGTMISGRLYCTPKAAWRLRWFLREFGYDAELLDQNVIDEKALVGLQGIINVSHSTLHGRPVLNLDGFAPAGQWIDTNGGS